MQSDAPKLDLMMPDINEELSGAPDPMADAALTEQAVALRNADRDLNGRISGKEAAASLAIRKQVASVLLKAGMERVVLIKLDTSILGDNQATNLPYIATLPPAFVIDNQPLFDSAAMNQATHRVLGISVLPKGVGDIELSDFCGKGVFPCQNLPNGKILVNVSPAPKI